MEPASESASEVVEGRVRRVIHRTPEGWAALDVGLPSGANITVVGRLPRCSPGETVKARGKTEEHARYGRRLVADECEVESPTTEEGLVEVLASLVDGVGEKRAKSLVGMLGGVEGVMSFLQSDRSPFEHDSPWHGFNAFSALDVNRYCSLRAAWKQNVEERSVDLASLGLPPALRQRLRSKYGKDAVSVLRSDPYRLCREVEGVGFVTADAVARKVGVSEDSLERLCAALSHFLSEEAESRGHIFHEGETLVSSVNALCGWAFSLGTWAEALCRASERGDIVVSEGGNVAHGALARDEEKVVAFACVRMDAQPDPDNIYTVSIDSHWNVEQRAAIETSLRSEFSVITGGPGTGKTTITKELVSRLESADRSLLLCAPTGRAARRLSEATSRETSTIHRLLGWRGGSFEHSADNPLDCDVCLVDEASMVDVRLLRALCEALPSHASLVLVGDADQLPPVGPGAPLRDLVSSCPSSVSRLTEVHRQAAGSRIVSGAREILSGKLPTFSAPGDRSDGALYMIEEADPEKLRDLVVELAAEVAPSELGVRPEDVQVLSPRRRGVVGVRSLNEALQRKAYAARYASVDGVRPVPTGFHVGKREDVETVFCLHDRVMQTKNDYERGVVNGETGVVVEIGYVDGMRKPEALKVDFDGRLVSYDREQLRGLDLAYCATVHKAQGSEYPVVILVCHDSHGFGLDRALVYTAVTRAKKACFIVGTRRALGRACRNGRSDGRKTTLPAALERSRKRSK